MRPRWGVTVRVLLVCGGLAAAGVNAAAHSGPPYPVVTNRATGPYIASLWTDPDATDNRTAAGKFWVTIAPAAKGAALPPGTRARVSIRALDRQAPALAGTTAPVNQDVSNQFVALLMDHEGPFAVHVAIEGPLGPGALDANVDATYDLRPARFMLALFVMPFVLVGLLWGKLLLKRRQSTRRVARRQSRPS
jgi:hypothetical protein